METQVRSNRIVVPESPRISLGDTSSTMGRLEVILRVAVAAEFIGHGAFGIFGKEGWLAYYAALGIPESMAWYMMPATGAVDIALGFLLLARPMRAPLAWMAFWGLFTAVLRPLAGQGIWEVVERSYNYGVPLLLLMLYGIGRRADWGRISHSLGAIRDVGVLNRDRAGQLVWYMRVVISLYLIGHGALGAIDNKRLLLEGYSSIGLTGLVSDPAALNVGIGLFEIVLGLAVLAFPINGLLYFVLVWKLSTEMLYVTMDAYGAGFEVLERAGSYAAPLALICLKRIAKEPEQRSAVQSKAAPAMSR